MSETEETRSPHRCTLFAWLSVVYGRKTRSCHKEIGTVQQCRPHPIMNPKLMAAPVSGSTQSRRASRYAARSFGSVIHGSSSINPSKQRGAPTYKSSGTQSRPPYHVRATIAQGSRRLATRAPSFAPPRRTLSSLSSNMAMPMQRRINIVTPSIFVNVFKSNGHLGVISR